MAHLVIVGGSDAGISAGPRARELDSTYDVTLVVADASPNFSICGIPYFVSGDVADWHDLAHRKVADLEATGMQLRLDTTARRIDASDHKLLVTSPEGDEELLAYDALVVGTRAMSVRPPIVGFSGADVLAPADGVHLLHSMGDTFELMATLERQAPERAVIVGAGYIGLEMAEALVARGLAVVKIFDLAAARTGLRDHEALAAGLDPVTVASEADDHKAYYPGSHRIAMRYTGDRRSGHLLGLQLIGHRDAEVAKRVDIAVGALFHEMTVDAISDLDLSYIPPLGSPRDAVQMGAQAWVRTAGIR